MALLCVGVSASAHFARVSLRCGWVWGGWVLVGVGGCSAVCVVCVGAVLPPCMLKRGVLAWGLLSTGFMFETYSPHCGHNTRVINGICAWMRSDNGVFQDINRTPEVYQVTKVSRRVSPAWANGL